MDESKALAGLKMPGSEATGPAHDMLNLPEHTFFIINLEPIYAHQTQHQNNGGCQCRTGTASAAPRCPPRRRQSIVLCATFPTTPASLKDHLH
jgi:hypothetical protein